MTEVYQRTFIMPQGQAVTLHTLRAARRYLVVDGYLRITDEASCYIRREMELTESGYAANSVVESTIVLESIKDQNSPGTPGVLRCRQSIPIPESMGQPAMLAVLTTKVGRNQTVAQVAGGTWIISQFHDEYEGYATATFSSAQREFVISLDPPHWCGSEISSKVDLCEWNFSISPFARRSETEFRALHSSPEESSFVWMETLNETSEVEGHRPSVITEIERRFIVTNLPGSVLAMDPTLIVQDYMLAKDDCAARIRLKAPSTRIDVLDSVFDMDYFEDYKSRFTSAWFTLKGPRSDSAREEIESPVSLDIAKQLVRGSRALIVKNRYGAIEGEHVWDIDVFAGRNFGLIIAECETRYRVLDLQVPDYCAEEIAHPDYNNERLATSPYRGWGKKYPGY